MTLIALLLLIIAEHQGAIVFVSENSSTNAQSAGVILTVLLIITFIGDLNRLSSK